MDIKKPKAVIGTNSWGGAVAAKVFRGSSVDEQTLQDTIATAKEKGLLIFDLAQVYGLGKAQKKIGALAQKVLSFLQSLPRHLNIHQSRFANLWNGIWQSLSGVMWTFIGCTVRLTQRETLPR